MSEINVLVSGNVTPKVNGANNSKEENSGTDPAAMDFAAIFGGWMAQVMGQGQGSGFQSNSNPAGKEANSGQTGIQGLEGMLGSLRMFAGLNLGSVSGQDQQGKQSMMKEISPEIMTLLSQNTLQGDVTGSGMESGQLQTGKLPLSELDQYRVLITQLLQDMSGEISKVSIEPADVQGLLSQLSQELNLNTSTTKVDPSNSIGAKPNIQSTLGQLLQVILTRDKIQAQSQPTNAQPESNASQIGLQNKVNEQAPNTVQNANLSNQIMEYVQNSNFNREKTGVQTVPLNRNLTQNSNLIQDISLGQAQKGTQPEGLPPGNHLPQMNTQTETGQNGAGNEKYNLSSKGDITNSKDAGTGDPNSNIENFNVANLTSNSAANVVNKMSALPNLPVWQQVAQELQAKVLNQLPIVRELNIQLHPAELGQISISLTWNNGQVHMQMLASETATGQMLQSDFPQLRENLSQSGVQCGMMQMGFADSNQNFNQGRNQTFTTSPQNQNKQDPEDYTKINEVLDAISAINASDRGIRQTNRINVTA